MGPLCPPPQLAGPPRDLGTPPQGWDPRDTPGPGSPRGGTPRVRPLGWDLWVTLAGVSPRLGPPPLGGEGQGDEGGGGWRGLRPGTLVSVVVAAGGAHTWVPPAPRGAGPGRAGGVVGRGQGPRPQAEGTGGDTEGGEPGGAGDVAGIHPDHGGDEGAHRPGAAARTPLPALRGPARGEGPQGPPQPPQTTAGARLLLRGDASGGRAAAGAECGGGQHGAAPRGARPGRVGHHPPGEERHGAAEALQGEPRGAGLRHRRGHTASLLLAGRGGAVLRGEQQGQPAALHQYSPRLEFVETDGENGEETRGVCEPPQAAPTPHSRSLKPSPSPHRPALQPPGGPGGPPPFRAIPEEQTYMNEQGEQDPPSSAPRPAPRRALLPPHDSGMTEELAQKLQLRRALMED
ncbi:signal-transducing adaptor protein 2 isoform X1 [Strix aluco]|uniref:signal-transducing adaptor protein 2 isoform X1 n=1 Tax=Strix aluco TaxID=111821 RepID=UPI003DA42E56